MTTPPILSDTEIEARIASVTCSLSVPLTQADIAWIAENVRRWLKTYMFSDNSLSLHCHSCATPGRMLIAACDI